MRYKGRPSKRDLAARYPHQVALLVTEGVGVRFWPIFRKVVEVAGDGHADWTDHRGVEFYNVHGFAMPEHAAAFRAWIAETFPDLPDTP